MTLQLKKQPLPAAPQKWEKALFALGLAAAYLLFAHPDIL